MVKAHMYKSVVVGFWSIGKWCYSRFRICEHLHSVKKVICLWVYPKTLYIENLLVVGAVGSQPEDPKTTPRGMQF